MKVAPYSVVPCLAFSIALEGPRPLIVFGIERLAFFISGSRSKCSFAFGHVSILAHRFF